MAMLNSVWTLHDVQDAEKLCRRVMHDELHALRAHLEPCDQEDLLAYLLSESWILSTRYSAEHGISFSRYAYRTLRLRVTDFYRQRFDDYRSYRNNGDVIPEPALSLDRMGDDVATRGSSSTADLGTDELLRLLRDRRSKRAGDLDIIREALTRRSAA